MCYLQLVLYPHKHNAHTGDGDNTKIHPNSQTHRCVFRGGETSHNQGKKESPQGHQYPPKHMPENLLPSFLTFLIAERFQDNMVCLTVPLQNRNLWRVEFRREGKMITKL